MSFLSKIMDTMKLTPEAEEDEFLDEEEYEAPRSARKNLFNSKEAEDEDTEEEEVKPRIFGRSSKVVPMRKPMEVSLIKPITIEDASEICDLLLAGKAVVLNMEGIHTELAQRIIDFASGSTYAMNGNLQKISNYIFIATPENIELSGDFQEVLNNGTLDVSGLNIRL